MLQPSKFMRLLGMPFVCLAMFSLLGGHWTILQTVAWTQMVWNYSQTSGSLAQGLEKTFSGDHPCKLCHKVAEGRQKEEKAPATVKLDKKVETLLPVALTGWLRSLPESYTYPATAGGDGPLRFDAPPIPVPRAIA